MAARPVPVRADLVGVAPYGAPQIDVPIRLNTNENPFGPSPEFVRDIATAVAAAATTLNRYPDREAVALRTDLAAYLLRESGVAVDVDCVWVANGSNEIMHQILSAFGGPGRTALSFDPTYAMYPEYARDTFTRYVSVGRDEAFDVTVELALAALAEHQPDIVLLASPNNPTGTALSPAVIAAVCDAAPGIVVIDEADAEFRRPGSGTALELLATQPRLLVTRTMSKAFALAGARVGYVAAGDSRMIDVLQVVRLPYHLSSVSQAVARTALAHSDELQSQVALLRTERDDLVTWLRAKSYRVADSDANFVLFGCFADRHAIWESLLERGVLIRETGPAGWLRVSVGTPEENAAFRAALDAVGSGNEEAS